MGSYQCVTRCLAAVVLSLGLFSQAVAAPATGKYLNIVDQMRAVEKQYPQFAKIFSIGTNDDDVEILGLRISTSPQASDPQKATHLIVGTHHGNETAAPVFVMAYVKTLVERYNSSDLFRTNLLATEWNIIPVLNISGYNAGNRNEKGQDPNRDYPGPCTNSGGGRLKSVRTLMDFMKTRTFAGSLTVHGYLGAMTYPWGVDVNDTHTLDHNYFQQITEKAADIAGYRYGTSTDIVYPCDGAFEDYSYWKYGMWSLLLELENGSASDIQSSVAGITSYFDELAASPSSKNQLKSQCQRSGRADLRLE